MTTSADCKPQPQTLWNQTIVWGPRTPIKKVFPLAEPKLELYWRLGVSGLSVVLVGYIFAHLLSLSPSKIDSSSENPLSLSTVITSTTVLAGIYLYLERPEAEKHYRRRHRELVGVGSFLLLFIMFALSAAYTLLPAINGSHCTEETTFLFHCFIVGEFWIELTSATTLIHLIVLSVLFFGGVLLQLLRIPRGLARRDRITENAHLIQESLVRIAALQSSNAIDALDEASLWSAPNPRKQKLKLYGFEALICLLHWIILTTTKVIPICILRFFNQLPSWPPELTWCHFLIVTSFSSFMTICAFYSFHSVRAEYQKLSAKVPSYLFFIVSAYFSLSIDLILTIKLTSPWPLITSLAFSGTYACFWHRATKEVLPTPDKKARNNPSRFCDDSHPLSTTEIQKNLDHQKRGYFKKVLTSFSIASKFDRRLHFSEATCYLLPESPEGSSSWTIQPSKSEGLRRYSCRAIISTHLTINSFNARMGLLQLIEYGLELRSNQEDYNAAIQGEIVAIDKTIVPSANTRSYSTSKTLFNFNDHWS